MMWATYICQTRVHSRLRAARNWPVAYDRTVDVAGQITGNEHEELGGIAEAVIAQGQPGNEVVRNVIEEDHPQSDAAEQIEPEVALDGKRERYPVLIGHHALPISSSYASGRRRKYPRKVRRRRMIDAFTVHTMISGKTSAKITPLGLFDQRSLIPTGTRASMSGIGSSATETPFRRLVRLSATGDRLADARTLRKADALRSGAGRRSETREQCRTACGSRGNAGVSSAMPAAMVRPRKNSAIRDRFRQGILPEGNARRNRRGTLDPRRVSRPDGRGIVVASDAAFFSPQDHRRTRDLSPGLEVRGVHVQVDAEGGPVVFAHAVDGSWVLDAPDIFGQRAGIEKAGALSGL